jgi:hypothetical protein
MTVTLIRPDSSGNTEHLHVGMFGYWPAAAVHAPQRERVPANSPGRRRRLTLVTAAAIIIPFPALAAEPVMVASTEGVTGVFIAGFACGVLTAFGYWLGARFLRREQARDFTGGEV